MRGRLIFPFLARIHRLDRRAMHLPASDGARHHASGLDPDFKEPVRLDPLNQGVASQLRRERLPVDVPCQVEPRRFERFQMQPSGAAPGSLLELVMHFRDLEKLGLVNRKTGNAKLLPGDRLGALLDLEKTPQLTIRDPPGLFIVEVRPTGFGLGRRKPQRNLLIVKLDERRVAARRTA